MFNRRRPGETQFLEVDEFLKQTSISAEHHDEIYASLPIAQKVAANRLTLVMTRGKRDRGVPVLLMPNMKESIEILIKSRNKVGVHEQNPYIFACPTSGSLLPLRGHDCVFKFAQSCGAENPQNLTATKLRKHLATLTQILNLTKSELEQLADHLGHNIDVHKKYYRLPQEVLFLAKVSKVLMAADSGKISKYKGKSLEEMDINDQVSDTELSDDTSPSDEEGSSSTEPQSVASLPNHNPGSSKGQKKHVSRTKWSPEEEQALSNDEQVSVCIRMGHPPNAEICQKVKDSNPCLSLRSIVQIKSKVWNLIQRERRRSYRKK